MHRAVAKAGPLALLFAVAFGLVIVGVLLAGRPPDVRAGGPLATDTHTKVETHLAIGVVGTWGTVLPGFDEGPDVVIEAIEPTAAVGVDIVQMFGSDPRKGAVGTAATFPPPGIEPEPIAGAVITPRSGATPYFQLIMGVRLTGDSKGRIDGLRVRYRVGDLHYETVIADAYEVSPIGS